MSIEKIKNEAWVTRERVNQNSDKNLKDIINQIKAPALQKHLNV